jgi:hypothetical protein
MSNIKIIFIAVILFLAAFYFSCNKEKDPLKKYGPVVHRVIQSDNGAFRGFNFGDKIDTVSSKESSPPTESDKAYLYYEYRIDTTGSYTISYDFDENGLVEIQSDVFINNASQMDTVFNSFKRYFDDHFGKNETDMGYNVWTVKSETYGDIKINLTDESSQFTTDKSPGKISIWMYPDKD